MVADGVQHLPVGHPVFPLRDVSAQKSVHHRGGQVCRQIRARVVLRVQILRAVVKRAREICLFLLHAERTRAAQRLRHHVRRMNDARGFQRTRDLFRNRVSPVKRVRADVIRRRGGQVGRGQAEREISADLRRGNRFSPVRKAEKGLA